MGLHHDIYMHRCLYLASKGKGSVAPNPMVGAILVYENRIIGEGWHEEFGKAHAEVNCLNSVKENDKECIEKSTLYVSLEPCNHFGKTPPCSDLIIKNKIPKVILGCGDPFALVNGAGIKKLRDHGVEVTENICQTEAEELNKRFFIFNLFKRPYIILKWAQSSDRFLGIENEETKITNKATDVIVHKWRSEEAAIMIGKNTAVVDDPSLTNRHWTGKNPIRIIADSHLSTPIHYKVFNDEAPTMVLNSIEDNSTGRNKKIKIEGNLLTPQNMMEALWQQQILSVVIEGGAYLLNSFIEEGLWDEARILTNTKLKLGHGIPAPILLHSQKIREDNIGSDQVEYFTQTKHDRKL